MEPVFPHSAVVALLSLPGLGFFLFSLKEILDEYRFKQKAIRTQGRVTKALSSKYGSQQVERSGGTATTEESAAGYLLLIEYDVANGQTYTAKSKQSFRQIPSTVEVGYHPENPTDVMIESYYQSGNSKYYRLIMGGLLGVVPILAYWIFTSV